MAAIERDNKSLKGVLAKNYARPALDKARLGEVIDLIATIGLGNKEAREQDILGRVYEYSLGRFAEKEGKGGGEFYTPQSVVRLLVEMIEPYQGRVFDPCCGSGGMFVQAIIEDDGIPFEEKMAELCAELYEQMAEAEQLDAVIRRNLPACRNNCNADREVVGYGE